MRFTAFRRSTTRLACAAILLAACEEATGNRSCDLLAKDLEDAARCIAKSLSAPDQAPDLCREEKAKFHTAGFTSLDATKIVATSVKAFYSTYYGKDFCKNFFPKWLTRRLE